MHTCVCACVWGHVCEHTDLALRLGGRQVGGRGWIPLSLNMGRKVDFVFSPIKVKFGLETIARQFPGLSLGNSRPAGASLPFQQRLPSCGELGWGRGGGAVEAAHCPGCQGIRVISSTLVRGSAAIFTIFLTHELGRGFQESCSII